MQRDDPMVLVLTRLQRVAITHMVEQEPNTSDASDLLVVVCQHPAIEARQIRWLVRLNVPPIGVPPLGLLVGPDLRGVGLVPERVEREVHDHRAGFQ